MFHGCQFEVAIKLTVELQHCNRQYYGLDNEYKVRKASITYISFVDHHVS